jgi:hypothetical protein
VESTLLAGGKSKKKDGYLGDPARGQADPGSVAMVQEAPYMIIRVTSKSKSGF